MDSQQQPDNKEQVTFLLYPLNYDSKLLLLRNIWPGSRFTISDAKDEQYDTFFGYVQSELRVAMQYNHEFAAQSLTSLLAILAVIRSNSESTKTLILKEVKKGFINFQQEKIWRSLELASRIWLTINIKTARISVGPVQAPFKRIEWSDETPFNELIQDQFTTSSGNYANRRSKPCRLDDDLTVAYLVAFCGIQLFWTSNLTDHLAFDRKTRTLKVYQHKICLLNHLSSKTSVIPTSVVAEAIDTLNLLFPFGDSATKSLLIKEGKPFYRLENCERKLQLDLDYYEYWREELEDLMNILSEPPRNWRQLLMSQRNVLEWATFWNLCIAGIVAIFTIISIAFGTAQLVFTIKQYSLTANLGTEQPKA